MHGKKELIVKLQSMGFIDDVVERTFLYTGASSIEQAMYYLVSNSEGYWEHKFIPESRIHQAEFWLLCKRNK